MPDGSRSGLPSKPCNPPIGTRARRTLSGNSFLKLNPPTQKYVLILAGDHLYHMDYSKMLDFHIERGCGYFCGCAASPQRRRSAVREFSNRMLQTRSPNFAEKPKDPQSLVKNRSAGMIPEKPYLGSMGIYLFKTKVLLELLENSDHPDFGKQIIPLAIQSNTVYGYEFEGYWEDIGTIRSFYETNLALTKSQPTPSIFSISKNPIFTPMLASFPVPISRTAIWKMSSCLKVAPLKTLKSPIL